jgi:hypothetical protein
VEVPPGWVLVPAIPTEAMKDAGDDVELRHQAEDADPGGYYTRSAEIYAAMVQAAPIAVKQQPKDEHQVIFKLAPFGGHAPDSGVMSLGKRYKMRWTTRHSADPWLKRNPNWTKSNCIPMLGSGLKVS